VGGWRSCGAPGAESAQHTIHHGGPARTGARHPELFPFALRRVQICSACKQAHLRLSARVNTQVVEEDALVVIEEDTEWT
jgi:hypothetical protein